MLKVGDKAPDFSMDSDDGGKITLGDYKGKWLLLYFYPRDNTPGCSLEARDFSCMIDDFTTLGVSLVGASKDSVTSHGNFREKNDLTIKLGSDPEHICIEAYGAWREKKIFGKVGLGVMRSTFLIDSEGKIAAIWDKVKAKGHAEEVLATCKEKLNGVK